MKRYLMIICVLLAIGILFGQESHKQYVSTMGSRLYLNNNATFFTKYGVVKIKTVEGKNKFIEMLKNNVVYETTKHIMMANLLLLQIENRDYLNETIYIVYSPATYNVDLDQPYYYRSEDKTLVFDNIKSDKFEKESYSSIRVYLLKGDKTEFNKFILNDTTKFELEIEEF